MFLSISILACGKDVEFYIGFFRNYGFFYPAIIISNSEIHPVFYSVEAPGVGYYKNGTILADDRVVVNISESIMVSSYNDQNKGIYLKVSGDRVTVIGQSTTRNPGSWRRLRAMARNLDTFAIIETSDLHIKQYEYFAISVNDSIINYRNSSVLIVGTRNSTVMTLAVTQLVREIL